jgi:hypothetical protein
MSVDIWSVQPSTRTLGSSPTAARIRARSRSLRPQTTTTRPSGLPTNSSLTVSSDRPKPSDPQATSETNVSWGSSSSARAAARSPGWNTSSAVGAEMATVAPGALRAATGTATSCITRLRSMPW